MAKESRFPGPASRVCFHDLFFDSGLLTGNLLFTGDVWHASVCSYPMSLQCGIIGLPNVGKTTIFNALTAVGAPAENYPFCTIDQNVGIVTLKDPRLDKVAEIFRPEKVTPTTIEFVDIAGLVKGASHGEGLGNQFLGNIRNVDAIVHVICCFENPDVVHIYEDVNPDRDIEIIQTELALADLETVGRRLDKVSKMAKSGEKEAIHQKEVLLKIHTALNEGKTIRSVDLPFEEILLLKELFLLTTKPVLYVANVSDADITNEALPAVQAIQDHAAKEGAEVVVISGKIEAELAALAEEERAEFLKDMGLELSGLDRLSHAAYRLLKLITFFTGNPNEVRASTIREGTQAPQAAGAIHTDFEKHFIRAEVYHYDDLIECGSEHHARENGKMHIEGKDYVVKDGDIIYFRTSA